MPYFANDDYSDTILESSSFATIIMDMKKIACAVLVAAASMSAVLASDDMYAPAPAPAHNAAASLPVAGSLIGASVLSFFAFYLQ